MPQRFLVCPEDLPEGVRRAADRIVMVQLRPLLLYQSDLRHQVPRQGADVVALHAALPDQAVQDLSALFLPGHLVRAVAVGCPQDPEEEGMEGAEGDPAARLFPGTVLFPGVSPVPQRIVPVLHLLRGGPGEGDHQDALRPDSQPLCQVQDPAGDHEGLP